MSDYCSSQSLKPMAPDSAVGESIGLQYFAITLDKTPNVYYPSQVVTGRVHLQLASPINAIGIKVECRGEGQVCFTNRSTGFRRRVSANEIYLLEEILVCKWESGNTEVKSDGYPFSLSLAEKLPCSFEGRYGRVRYTIGPTLEITQDSKISAERISFTVAPVLDLNQHSLATLPISENHSKTFTGHIKPLSMSVFLPVRGFVPGQTVPLKINLKNESNVDVKKLRILFKKVIVYHSTDAVRKHKEIVVEIDQPVQRNCQLYDLEFDIPAIPPSGKICNLIDVNYTLKVEACVDINEWYYRMFHKNLKIRMAIVIGTSPLKHYEDPVESSDESSKAEMTKRSVDKTGQSKDALTTSSDSLKYQRSRIYRSSKPERDDPLGNDATEVKAYSPMYRVYKFEESKTKRV